MRKKFQALQKDIEEQREQLSLQHEQQKELYTTIKGEDSRDAGSSLSPYSIRCACLGHGLTDIAMRCGLLRCLPVEPRLQPCHIAQIGSLFLSQPEVAMEEQQTVRQTGVWSGVYLFHSA